MSDPTRARPDPLSEIRMLTLHATRGANYWSQRPVTRMDVDIGAYEDISSADVPSCTDRLVAVLPGLVEHYCSVGTRGGFIERLRTGTYAAHIAEHVALELQSMIGHEVGFGRTRGTGEVGQYTIVFEHRHQAVGVRAAALALETVQHAFAETLERVDHAIAELQAIAQTPDIPPLHPAVRCGITGGGARAAVRESLVELCNNGLVSDSELIIDVAPGYILQAGLPFSQADVAVILDTAITDVPERYRDAERAARLVCVIVDAVARRGDVVCPADAHYVHDTVRDAGRRVVKFAPSADPAERARRAAVAAAKCLQRVSAEKPLATPSLSKPMHVA